VCDSLQGAGNNDLKEYFNIAETIWTIAKHDKSPPDASS